MPGWLSRWRASARGHDPESDTDRELRFHVEEATRRNLARGMAPEEARRQALIALGGIARTREEVRDQRGASRLLDDLRQDLRYAARQFVRAPAFTATVVLIVALGIGATTAVFSLADATVFRPLPYPNPGRLVVVWDQLQKLGIDRLGVSTANFKDYRSLNEVFDEMAAFRTSEMNLAGPDQPERVEVMAVTPNLPALLGVAVRAGRGFTQDDAQPGRDNVVLLGHALWQRRFGGDPGAVGQTVRLNGRLMTVLGILPAGLRFTIRQAGVPQVWMPLALPEPANRNEGDLRVLARLKPGVTVERAQANMTAVAARLGTEYKQYRGPRGEDAGYTAAVVPLQRELFGAVRDASLALLAGIGLLLLVACANVATLLLGRAAGRGRELAVRAALGAGTVRLARQLAAETALLYGVGGAAGAGVAWFAVRAFAAAAPGYLPAGAELRLDARVLAVAAAATALAALLFGLLPLLQALSGRPERKLREGARTATAGRHHGLLRRGLVIAEIALSAVLLVGAGLLARSFLRLSAVDPGFQTNSLVSMRISLPESQYREPHLRASFFRQVLERAAVLPGAQSVAAISRLPLAGGGRGGDPFSIEGRPYNPQSRTPQVVAAYVATPEWFQTVGIPVLRGRVLSGRDTADAPRVAVINETMATGFWPGGNPIGHRIVVGAPRPNAEWATIVGVVGDVRNAGLDVEPIPQMYVAHPQRPAASMVVVARAAGDAERFAASITREVAAVDPSQPVYDVRTMEDRVAEAVAQPRFNSLLATVFAGMALVLAMVGLYGVVRFAVAGRTHEIGVRIALGASSSRVLRMIVGEGLRLALAGIVAGISASVVLMRGLRALLYGVSVTDGVTIGAVAMALVAVAVLASYLPARQATRIDPAQALRAE